MTMFQRKRIQEEIEKRNALFDTKADTFLDKLKASKWTSLILLAGIVVFVVALIS